MQDEIEKLKEQLQFTKSQLEFEQQANLARLSKVIRTKKCECLRRISTLNCVHSTQRSTGFPNVEHFQDSAGKVLGHLV